MIEAITVESSLIKAETPSENYIEAITTKASMIEAVEVSE